jgi:hypothetical protein
MRVRLHIHPGQQRSLASHLAAQGFPPTTTSEGELDVLFPGSASIFAAAVELDLWEARAGCACRLVIDPLTAPRGRALGAS